jgi:hypothetical protein
MAREIFGPDYLPYRQEKKMILKIFFTLLKMIELLTGISVSGILLWK